jgi:lipoprotein-anchoring transpeptidase ErfK/SrfK
MDARVWSLGTWVIGPVLATLAVVALMGVVWWHGSALVAQTLAPYNWRIDLPRTADGVSVNGSVAVFSPNQYARIQEVSLFEMTDADTRALPLRAIAPEGGMLERADGQSLLKPDRDYRLVVKGLAFDFGQSWPPPATVVREERFSTQPSPVPLLTNEAILLRYGQEVVVDWSQPLNHVEYEVTPPAKTRLIIDPAQPARTRVVLDEYRDSAEYRVSFTRALAVNGVSLQHPRSLTVVTPTFPRVSAVDVEPTLRPGQPLELRWNIPVRSVQVEGPSGVRATPVLDPQDPRITRVRFEGLAQGREYSVAVTAAQALDGAPLAERRQFRFRTPQPLAVAEFGPEDGATNVSRTAQPYVTFSEPVADRAAAERAFSIEPAVPGAFEWQSDTTLAFVPAEPFDYEATVVVRLAGGPNAAQSQAGGYVADETSFGFVTYKKKLIDVNLSRQVLMLYEGGDAVFTSPVATGVPGADTPIGTFFVEYKLSKARFRGTNVNGTRYDIPDVPWVLAFLGDYTIHAAPWRGVFGRVGSNGCVSLPTPAAKTVYDWADPGTQINIHY